MKDQDISRAQWLDFTKRRAMEYANERDYPNAVASFTSDMGKHDGTKNDPMIEKCMMRLLHGKFDSPESFQRFLNLVD